MAIIGMAGRFPGARDIEELWKNLLDGQSAIRLFGDEELERLGVDIRLRSHHRYVPAAGWLEGADCFDAEFFDMAPAEAAVVDPQQRLLLTCAWAALENAGYGCADQDDRSTGVYAGASPNAYALTNAYAHWDPSDPIGSLRFRLAVACDFLAARVADALGLRGPSVTVQTASSTSLTAVHLAIQGLLAGDCSLAVAGGVSFTPPSLLGHIPSRTGAASPSPARCSFSDRAERTPQGAATKGTAWGSGVGVVVLKRLPDALACGDTIHAVIKGSAINHDADASARGRQGPSEEGRHQGPSEEGRHQGPSEDGQVAVIIEALRRAGLSSDTIGFVEAHGSAFDDPIEFRALARAFRERGARRGPCLLGSTQLNLGNLDAAAGVVGLIKAALVVREGQIPPLLRAGPIHPEIDVISSPFRFSSTRAPWPIDDGPRRAGVSAVGVGGSNAHVILQQPPARPERPVSSASCALQTIIVSAKTAVALEKATLRLASHLASDGELDLEDVAFTLQEGRRAFSWRRAVVASSGREAARALRDGLGAPVASFPHPAVAFLFPGEGAQAAGMAARIYVEEPLFRCEVDRACGLLEPMLGVDLRRILYGSEDAAQRDALLEDASLAQPALFVVEYALARLWMSWGVRPRALFGHGIGEYAAACLAGVFSLGDALHLVAARGRLTQETPPGAMLAVREPEHSVVDQLGPTLSLAASNAPSMCVVAGPEADVEDAARAWPARGVECCKLRAARALYSPAMDPAMLPYRRIVAAVPRQSPEIPLISGVTGAWMSDDDATNPDYWARQMRLPIRFAAGLGTLWEHPARVMLEVGPGQMLTTLALASAARQGGFAHTFRAADFRGTDEHGLAVACCPPGRSDSDEHRALLAAVAALWQAGIPIAWDQVRARKPSAPRRVPLPTYPFQEKRHWVEAPSAASARDMVPDSAARPARHD